MIDRDLWTARNIVTSRSFVLCIAISLPLSVIIASLAWIAALLLQSYTDWSPGPGTLAVLFGLSFFATLLAVYRVFLVAQFTPGIAVIIAIAGWALVALPLALSWQPQIAPLLRVILELRQSTQTSTQQSSSRPKISFEQLGKQLDTGKLSKFEFNPNVSARTNANSLIVAAGRKLPNLADELNGASKNLPGKARPTSKPPAVYWNAWLSGDTPPSANVLTVGQFYTFSLDISAFSYSDLRSNALMFPVSVLGDAGIVALLSAEVKSTILTIKPIISEASGLVIVEPKDAYDMSVDLDKLRKPDMNAIWRYKTSKGPVVIPEGLSAGKISFKIRTRLPGCASMSFAIFEDLRPLDHLVLRVVTKDRQGNLPACANDAANAAAPLTGGLDALRDAALGMESQATRVVGEAALYIFDADENHSLVVFVDGRKTARRSIYGWQTDGSIVDFLKTSGFDALVAKAQKDAAKNLDGAYVRVAQQIWSLLVTASAASGTMEEAKAGADAFKELVREAKSTPVIVVRVASSLGTGATRSLFVPFGILGAKGSNAVFDKPIVVVQPMATERFVSKDRCIGDWTLALPQALESVPDDVMDVDHFPKPLPGTRIKDIAGFSAFLGNEAFPSDRPASGLIVLAHQGEGALWFDASTNRIIKQNISHHFSPGSVGILSACSMAAAVNRNAELLQKFNEQGLDTLIASPFTLDASYGVEFAYSFSETVQEAVAAGQQPTIVELFNRAIKKTGDRFAGSNIGNYKELGLEYVLLGNPAIRLCAGATQPSAH
jgi:hypothetical protein